MNTYNSNTNTNTNTPVMSFDFSDFKPNTVVTQDAPGETTAYNAYKAEQDDPDNVDQQCGYTTQNNAPNELTSELNGVKGCTCITGEENCATERFSAVTQNLCYVAWVAQACSQLRGGPTKAQALAMVEEYFNEDVEQPVKKRKRKAAKEDERDAEDRYPEDQYLDWVTKLMLERQNKILTLYYKYQVFKPLYKALKEEPEELRERTLAWFDSHVGKR